jgi:uncharacterized membrane protein
VRTPAISIICFILTAALGAAGQFLYRNGAKLTTSQWTSYLLNWRILGGVACYVAVMALFVMAFKRGGQLTVLYPIYASTFIWAAVLAWQLDGVPIRAVHVLGMLLLVAGMFLMGR